MVGTDEAGDSSVVLKKVDIIKPPTFTVLPLEQIVAPFAVITDKQAKFCQTNRALLNTIDGELCTPEQLSEILVLFTNTLFYGLNSYRIPSAASRKAVTDGKVRWRNKDVSVHKTEQEFVIKLSDELQLDELQCFDLFRSYLHDTSLEQGEAFAYDDEGFQAVKNMYYAERKSLIDVIIILMRNMMSDSIFQKQSQDLMEFLISQKLDEQLLHQLVDLAEETPLHMRDEAGAQHMLEELVTLLCALFLIYYHLPEQASDNLGYIIKVFKAMGFGENVSAADYSYIQQVERSIGTVKNMCVMVVLAAMQLEDLQEEEKWANHPYIVKMEEIEDEIFKDAGGREWLTLDVHGPVLLAWSLWGFAAAKERGPAQQAHAMTQLENALNFKAVDYLVDMLSYGLEKTDIAITGYKSVVNSLTSGFLVFFSEDTPWLQEVPIFKLYCLASENTPALVNLFWRNDLLHPLLGGYARHASQKFPVQCAPLLRLMKAMGNEEYTESAYGYIENMTTYASEVTSQNVNHIQLDEDEINALALAPIYSPGYIVPTNSRGEAIASNVISWTCNYDGWHWILNFLTNLASNLKRRLDEDSTDYETALSSLHLISHLMKLDEELAHKFYSIYDGVLPKLLPSFILDCIYYKQPLPLVAAGLDCAHYFAKTCNVVLMWRRLSPTLFQMVRSVLRDREESSAHPVTISVLRLVYCVVKRSVQQERQNAEPEIYVDTAVSLQPSEMEEALNFCHEIFPTFSSWVYNNIEEKWKIGIKAMKISHRVLTYYAPSGLPSTDDPSNLRVHRSALARILTNKDTQRTLFAIVGLGVEIFDKLRTQRRKLESFILHALALIDTALTRLPEDQVTTLQDALFDSNRLDCIASFSRYRTNPEITVRALRILMQASRTKIPLSTYIYEMGKVRVSWLASLVSSSSSTSSSSTNTPTPSSVRFHVLTVLCSIVQNQPSMIIALCSKKGIEPPLPTDGTSVVRRDEESKNSLGKVIINLMQAKLMENEAQVQVCSELCRLIYLIFKTATNLDTVQDLRANKQFWDHLVEIVMSHHSISPYHTSARGWALLAISQELNVPKHIAQGGFATIANSATQNLWVANNIPTNLTEEIEQFKPYNGFETVPVITSTFDLDRLYGERYIYDVSRLENKAAPELLIERIKEANIWLSKADSYSFFLRSWSTFLYSCIKYHVAWFSSDMLAMVAKIAVKLREALVNENSSLSLIEGVAPLFLVTCKLVPTGAKTDGKTLTAIFSDIADVFRKPNNTNSDALSYLCSGLVLLIGKVELISGTWRDAELVHGTENLVGTCWALVESESVKLSDSIICLLGNLLKVTHSPLLILNSSKQPSLLVLMSVLARALYKEDSATHAANILSLISRLAADPNSASALLRDGILNVLCSNAPFFTTFSHPAYTKSDQRNPWHRVWCACVTVVAQLLRTLKFTEEAPRCAIEFVNAHSDKLWEALNVQNKDLKYGTLEEIEKALQLFKELAIFTNRWKFAPAEFANKWGMCIVRLTHYLVSVFSAENGIKSRLSSSRDATENTASDELAKEGLLLTNIVNCLFFLQLSGPQIPRMLSAKGNPALLAAEVDSVSHIFAPSSDLSSTSPNLGILIYAIHHAFRALKSAQNDYPTKFTPRHRPSLLSIIELSLTLFLSHILYFLHKLDLRAYPELVQQVHGVGEEMVHSLHSYLVDLNGNEEEEFLMIKYYFLVLANILRVNI